MRTWGILYPERESSKGKVNIKRLILPTFTTEYKALSKLSKASSEDVTEHQVRYGRSELPYGRVFLSTELKILGGLVSQLT